jgi:hypothetical protein
LQAENESLQAEIDELEQEIATYLVDTKVTVSTSSSSTASNSGTSSSSSGSSSSSSSSDSSSGSTASNSSSSSNYGGLDITGFDTNVHLEGGADGSHIASGGSGNGAGITVY